MLRISVSGEERWDSENERFIKPEFENATLLLEHSLISLSKWESKWKKPFLDMKPDAHSLEETLDYIRCMTINENINPKVYECLTPQNIQEINDYISDPMTATTINQHGGKKSTFGREVITSEIIYYWMITMNIPKEMEKWHLNRLLTLINVISIKTQPQQKMTRRQQAMQYKMLNEQRRAKYHTRG